MRQSYSKNRTYSNIFLSMTTSISITVFILSIIFYMNFSNIALSIIDSYVTESLHQVSYSAAFMTSSAQTMMKQLYSDSNIVYLLNNKKPDYPQLTVSLNQLNAYKSSSQFVHSIYIYNGRMDTFYSTLNNGVSEKSAFPDQHIIGVLADSSQNSIMEPIPRNAFADQYDKQGTNVYSFILSDYSANPDTTPSSIILNISEEWIRDIVGSMQQNSDGDIVVIDAQGNIVGHAAGRVFASDTSMGTYISQVLAEQKSRGSFIFPVDDVESLVTYVSSDTLDWKFVRVTPYSNILNKISRMGTLTLTIGILIFLCGLLCSIFISKRIYRPINSMESKISKLESESRNQFYIVKQDFLRKILRGDSLANLGANPSMQIHADQQICLILCKIDHFIDFCGRLNLSDRNLYRYSFINIAQELFSAHFIVEAVDSGEDHIVLILASRDGYFDVSAETLDPIITDLRYNTELHLAFSFSVAITNIGTMKKDLKSLYSQASQLISNRIFYGHGCNIYHNRLPSFINSGYTYPMEKEKNLIEALMNGDLNLTKRLYCEIIAQVHGYSYNTAYLTILRLLTAVNIALEAFEKDIGAEKTYQFSEFISILNNLETMEEINGFFFQMFEQIAAQNKQNSERKASQHQLQLVNQAIDEIEKNYQDKNLSLEMVACAIGISSSYLGRLFKKTTFKSVSDYINKVRLDHAKTLLLDTDKPINEIADIVGCSGGNYFYSIFKKSNGVTPNVYRQCNGKLPENETVVKPASKAPD